jgi:hypothetical protein
MEKIFEDIGISKDFVTRIQIAQAIRVSIKKWDYIILKSFYIYFRNGKRRE